MYLFSQSVLIWMYYSSCAESELIKGEDACAPAAKTVFWEINWSIKKSCDLSDKESGV